MLKNLEVVFWGLFVLFLSVSCGSAPKFLTANFQDGKAHVNVKETQIKSILTNRYSRTISRNIDNSTYYLVDPDGRKSGSMKNVKLLWFLNDGTVKEITLDSVSNENKKTLYVSAFDLIPEKKVIVAGRIIKKIKREKIIHTFIAEYDWTGKLISEKVLLLNGEGKSEWVEDLKIIPDGVVVAADYFEMKIGKEPGFFSGALDARDHNINNFLVSRLDNHLEPLWTKMEGAANEDDSVTGFEILNDGLIVYGVTQGDLFGKHSGGDCVLIQLRGDGARVPIMHQCNDLFLKKYDLNGNSLWATQLGQNGRKSFDEDTLKHNRRPLMNFQVGSMVNLQDYSRKNNEIGFSNSILNKEGNEIYISGWDGQSASLYKFSTSDGALIEKNQFKYEGVNNDKMDGLKKEDIFAKVGGMHFDKSEKLTVLGYLYTPFWCSAPFPIKYFYYIPVNAKIADAVFIRNSSGYIPFFIDNEEHLISLGYYGDFEYFLPENAELKEEKIEK